MLFRGLYDMGYIERYGYGIIRMREAVAKHPFAEMEISTRAMKTEVIFKSTGPKLEERGSRPGSNR